MAADDRVRWDEIYRRSTDKPYPPPDPFLYEYTPPVAPGEERRALDLAAGLGQNGLWLAEQGYIVDITDVSRVALKRARDEMNARRLRNVNLLQLDLDDFDPEPYTYDLVCVFRYLKRDALPAIRSAVKPGGRIIYESYNLNYLRRVPGFNVRFLLQPGELVENFAGWQIIANRDDDYITRMVAVRPPGHVTRQVPVLAQDSPQDTAAPATQKDPFDW